MMDEATLFNFSAGQSSDHSTSTTLSLYDEGVISLQQLNAFYQFTPLGIVLGLLGVLTSILNTLANSCCRHDVYFAYFMGVSVGDGIYLTSVSIGFIINLFFPSSSCVYETYFLYVSTFVSTVFRRGAVVLNGFASSERFIKLIFPFKLSVHVLSRYPRCLILAVFVLSILANLSLALEFEVREVMVEVWMIVPSRLRVENSDLFLVLRNVSRMAFFYVPVIYLLVINVALVAALRMHASEQMDIRATRGARGKNNREITCEKSGNQMQQERSRPQVTDQKNIQTQAVMRTSRLVLILTLTFVLFALPTVVNSTVTSFVSDYGYFTRNHYLTCLLSYLAEWIVYLTQPFLFFVSIILSRKFRKSLLKKLHLTHLVNSIFTSDDHSMADITQSVTS